MSVGKKCNKCGELKGRSEFSPARDAADGLHGTCKACRAKKNAKRYREKKPSAKQYTKKPRRVAAKKECRRCGGMFAPQALRQGACKNCLKDRSKIAGVDHAADPLDGIGNSFESCIHKVKVLRERVKALKAEMEAKVGAAENDLRAACQQLADTSDEE